jgi:hypothetical protein
VFTFGNELAKLASKVDSKIGRTTGQSHHHWCAPLTGIIGQDPWQHVPNTLMMVSMMLMMMMMMMMMLMMQTHR